jgi:endo-beta-N-acetylglucosaminidase D
MKKFISMVLVFALLISISTTSLAETPKGDHQPYLHGYNVRQILSWSPDTDPFAKYFRSRIPLAQRIPSFSATQANPSLSAEAQVMNCSADYDKSFFKGYRYNDSFCRNLLNFWQYTDLYSSWHGVPVYGSPTGYYKAEFGVINLPNPAYTDAAHRNGVLSMGCWFWPRRGQDFSKWIQQKPDGSFPVADKMIEMAQYFGFDGYFINQEGSVRREYGTKLMEMIKYMRAKAPNFHLQWYDCFNVYGQISYVNGFNSENSPWVIDNGTPVNNSMFMNYAWNDSRLINANNHAKSLGLNPLEVLFAGTENDKYQFNPPYDQAKIFPNGEAPRCGWGLFGTDFVWNKHEDKFNVNRQDEVFQRERIYWSGPNENPTNTGRNSQYPKWDGVAHYIPARSVIGSYPFITRFNTGHGLRFFIDGKQASDKEWNDAGIQDILPSWQWWTVSNGNALKPSVDYSTAYNGGSSLKIQGQLNENNTTDLKLFKTKLLVTNNTELSITYKGIINGASNMKVGLVFEDSPNVVQYIEVGTTTDQWNTKTLDLSQYNNRTIATILLRFKSSEDMAYEMNIGEIALTNEATHVPSVPTGFKIDESYMVNNQAEVFLSWDFDSSNIWYYDIYRINSDNTKEYIGRTYDEVYYVKSLAKKSSDTSSTLKLVAVSFDGSTSDGIETTFNWDNQVIKEEIKVDLSSYFNKDGFSYDRNRRDGNFDLVGYCYSADNIDSIINYDDTEYELGSFADRENNVVYCNSQNIDLQDGKYSSIKLLGASTHGHKTGFIRINYSDNTFTDVEVTINDWCNDNNNPKIAKQMSHRHSANSDNNIRTYIFAHCLTPDTSKTVTSIILPNLRGMNIMAITLEKDQ